MFRVKLRFNSNMLDTLPPEECFLALCFVLAMVSWQYGSFLLIEVWWLWKPKRLPRQQLLFTDKYLETSWSWLLLWGIHTTCCGWSAATEWRCCSLLTYCTLHYLEKNQCSHIINLQCHILLWQRKAGTIRTLFSALAILNQKQQLLLSCAGACVPPP